ncbi:putative uncharacterized protein GUCA1ANB [Corvus hawaiiensis]|uniref:putative uncharacterized protein GUCA1ANB n=1 Tax=Corvus hawaiiensis TaxID=134902 RepID=UPI0020189F32|nr:putative uncharacterized protein GUCA1ANB [Corvus hawaiiensis]
MDREPARANDDKGSWGWQGQQSVLQSPAVLQAAEVAKTPEAPGKDHTRPEGMEKAKAMPEVTNTPPMPRNRPPPAPPLGSRFVPFVAHTGGRPLGSFDFVFYRPECSNSLAPFCTMQKPFCRARFQEGTDHCRRKIDVENANIMKWRSMHGRKP